MRLPWQIPVGLLAALGVACWIAIVGWGRAGDARRELAMAEESRQLEAAKIQEAHAVEVRDLRAKDNLSQRRLADALKAAGIKSTPFVTVAGSTGPVQSSGAAPPGPASATPSPGSSAGVGGSICLLYAGEQGEIRVTGAAARAKAGNVAVDAQADAYASGRHLFGGPLRLDVSYAGSRVSSALRAGWGAGVAGALGPRGWTAGPALALPPLSLLGFQAESTAAITLGPGGEWFATGSLVLRRSGR